MQLKSDLKEVLKLTREKSDDLISEFYKKEGEKTPEKVKDLEYYVSSLLDITKEMKKLYAGENVDTDFKSHHINIDSQEFDNFLGELSNTDDEESLREILQVLENWERYELCAKVNERIKLVMAKSA